MVVVPFLAYLFVPPVQDFALTVIRTATNKGVLEIETDDEDLEITVKQAGKVAVAEVLHKKKKWIVEISAADGEIEARERGPDGLGVKSITPFQLTRGGKVSFTARVLAAERAPPLVVEAGFQPLFNGKDLAGWVPVLDPKIDKAQSPWRVVKDMSDTITYLPPIPVGKITCAPTARSRTTSWTWNIARTKRSAPFVPA